MIKRKRKREGAVNSRTQRSSGYYEKQLQVYGQSLMATEPGARNYRDCGTGKDCCVQETESGMFADR